ncbi:hypothetical protein [Paenibacillus sp. QZ-Y1]|uniref:hypothetical protein n=1 Tax=Paenibacillus sp. QZ-Y1 TaxID=3414511 RepID=UPI003F7B30BA
MELAPTIRSHIEDYIKEKGYKLQQFANTCGVNVGTMSAVLKGSRPLAMNQLDQITSGMGLEKGYFYEMYSVECFIDVAPHWRRLEPFLYGCAELNKLNCIKRVIIQVTDNRSYISELFEMAEDLYSKGMSEAALILYECVADCEKYQHSERLALCQYRIFSLHKTKSKFDNLNAAVKFEPYIEKLDEEVQLDAIKDLANVYNTIHLWDKVYELAEELERKVDFQLDLQSRRRKNRQRIAYYPIFTYKAYANLLMSSVFDARKEYESALKHTEIYVNVIEIKNPTHEDSEIIQLFQKWAQGNRYLYQLMLGNEEVIYSYLDYVEANPEEILTAFVGILKAANQYLFDIDFALDRFDSCIRLFNNDTLNKGKYNDQMLNHAYISLYYELARYRFYQQNYSSGIEGLLSSLELSSSSNDDLMSIKCIDLYGKFRNQASDAQEEQYRILIESLSVQEFGK